MKILLGNKSLRSLTILVLCTSVLLSAACTTNKTEQVDSKEAKSKRQLENRTPTLNFEPETAKNIIKHGNFSKHSATTVMSEDKKYRVTLYSNVFPIPMQKIHSWTAHIETADGKPLEKAAIYIHGGMPIHRHGFPVKPRVKKNLGNGNYLIKGVKFSMIGEWEMRINIKEPTVRDRAIFKINIAQ